MGRWAGSTGQQCGEMMVTKQDISRNCGSEVMEFANPLQGNKEQFC